MVPPKQSKVSQSPVKEKQVEKKQVAKKEDKAKFESPEIVLDKVRVTEKSPEPKESSKERIITSP